MKCESWSLLPRGWLFLLQFLSIAYDFASNVFKFVLHENACCTVAEASVWTCFYWLSRSSIFADLGCSFFPMYDSPHLHFIWKKTYFFPFQGSCCFLLDLWFYWFRSAVDLCPVLTPMFAMGSRTLSPAQAHEHQTQPRTSQVKSLANGPRPIKVYTYQSINMPILWEVE